MVDFNKLLEERRKLKMAKKSGRSVKVDMAGVEAGGVLIPEGDYIVTVDEITQEEGQSSGKPYLKFVLVVSEGDKKGSKLWHKTSLQPQALFNLKNTLIALGQPVPNKAMNIDLDALEGESMMVSVGHEVYEGKKRSQVTDVFPLEGGESEEEDDRPDFDEMNLKELVAFSEENEYDLELSAKDMKKVDKVRAAVIEAFDSEEPEEEEDIEEEESEEEDDRPDFAEMDLKELLAFAEENEYELELSVKNKKKVDMVRAAVEAAYEADDSEEEEDTEERPDLDDMDLKGMLAYAEAEDLEIKLSVKNKKNVTKVREALQAIFDAEE